MTFFMIGSGLLLAPVERAEPRDEGDVASQEIQLPGQVAHHVGSLVVSHIVVAHGHVVVGIDSAEAPLSSRAFPLFWVSVGPALGIDGAWDHDQGQEGHESEGFEASKDSHVGHSMLGNAGMVRNC